MRLRELELMEKVAGNSKLSVVLGEKGLAERVVTSCRCIAKSGQWAAAGVVAATHRGKEA